MFQQKLSHTVVDVRFQLLIVCKDLFFSWKPDWMLNFPSFLIYLAIILWPNVPFISHPLSCFLRYINFREITTAVPI